MTAMRPVKVFSLKVPPGGQIVEINPGVPASIRITMASIDPEEPTDEVNTRATLRILHNVLDFLDGEDLSEYDMKALEHLDDETETSDDESVPELKDPHKSRKKAKAGPSNPGGKSGSSRQKLLDETLDLLDGPNGAPNGVKSQKGKGKGRALDASDEEEEDTESPAENCQEYVVCTLDRNSTYQVPLDLVIGEDEECYFRNSGGSTIYLTGNFVISEDQEDDGSECESDESDDDDLMELADLEYDSEDDMLDHVADPRVMEIHSEEEKPPQLTKASKGKGKRSAESETEKSVDSILNSTATREDTPHTKKLKTGRGQAVAGPNTSTVTKAESQAAGVNEEKAADKVKEAAEDKAVKAPEVKEQGGKKQKNKGKNAAGKNLDGETPGGAIQSNGKKVQFAEKLKQGPTPSKETPSKEKDLGNGVQVVNDVTIMDKTLGNGNAVKHGDRVQMRYIGKLDDGKQFDANKTGKPFSFKIGDGSVIKGWDIGVRGMCVGGERRIVIPPKHGYGTKAVPGIPTNSKLTFDLKLLAIN